MFKYLNVYSQLAITCPTKPNERKMNNPTTFVQLPGTPPTPVIATYVLDDVWM